MMISSLIQPSKTTTRRTLRVNTINNITYKDGPTIFAWELINEPRCESDLSGNKLQAWFEEMAVYVKSIDPKHLLDIGVEGFYGPSTPNKVSMIRVDLLQLRINSAF